MPRRYKVSSTLAICAALLIVLCGVALVFTVFGGVLGSISPRNKIYAPSGDQYCAIYKQDVCIQQCGCGFCSADNGCYSRDTSYCAPNKWVLGDSLGCQDDYANYTRLMANTGYASIALAVVIVVSLFVIWVDRKIRVERPRANRPAEVENKIVEPSESELHPMPLAGEKIELVSQPISDEKSEADSALRPSDEPNSDEPNPYMISTEEKI